MGLLDYNDFAIEIAPEVTATKPSKVSERNSNCSMNDHSVKILREFFSGYNYINSPQGSCCNSGSKVALAVGPGR